MIISLLHSRYLAGLLAFPSRLTLLCSSIAIALLAAFVFPAATQAQEIPQSISPLQVEPDRNGVNIVTGKMTPGAPVLSVPAAPRLKFDRVQNAAPFIRGEQFKNFDTTTEMSGSWTIHTADGMSESFRCVFGDDGKFCTSISGSGSSLVFNGFTYRKAGSGELYTMGNVHVFTTPSPGDIDQRLLRQSYVSKIEYPDGEVISYSYNTATLSGDPYNRPFYRPSKISTNLGYFITITYQGDDLTQVGWGSPKVVALYKASDPTTPLAQLTSNGNGSVTDLAGRTFQGFDLGDLGINVETASFSKTLPGEATPATVVVPATGLPSGAQMIGSASQDGVQWSYSYTNPRYYTKLDGYFYDKVQVSGPDGYYRNYSITQSNQAPQDGGRNIISSVTDELGRKTSFIYESGSLRINKITYPEGNSIALAWDNAGNIISKTSTAKPGSALASTVEQSFVDLSAYTSTIDGHVDCKNTVLCWRPTWYRDALGRQTDYAYNANGQLTEQTDPADAAGVRRKTYVEYETFDTGAGIISRKKTVRVCGAGTTCGTDAEIRTEYEYWNSTSLPLVERQRDLATGQVRETRYTYDAAGRVLSIDGPRPGWDDTQYFRYDVLGRKTWEIGPLAPNGLRAVKRYSYRDSDDKITVVESGTLTDPASSALTVLTRTDLTYDSHRNAIREVVTAGGQTFKVTDYSYLDRGMLDCTAMRMNLAALPAASSSGACAQGATGSYGRDRISKNIYDAAAQLIQVKQAFGSPLVRNQVTYSYTPNGKPEFITDANGNKAQFAYDGFDRQTYWYFPHKTAIGTVNAADFEQYGYDAAGNRTSLRRRDGRVLTFSYDALNRNIVKIVPDGCAPIQVGACAPAASTRDIYYSYDLMGRQLTARFDTSGGADGVTNAYDVFGNLRSSTTSMGGFTKVLSSSYDLSGNRVQLIHPDGRTFSYNYDALGRLGGLYEGADTTVPLAQFSYNPQGLVVSRIESMGSKATYSYDAIGRPAVQADEYSDSIGNVTLGPIAYNPASQVISKVRSNSAYSWRDAVMVNRAYAANGLNQYTSAGTASFTYDANGNLTSDGTNGFAYDAENRLISTSSGASLSYDPLGRLWRVDKGATSRLLLYDGDALVGEYDGSGSMVARYVHGSNAGADDPLVWYCSASAPMAQKRGCG